MVEQLELGSVTVDVVKKAIKNIHLSVHPPTGRVRIAAPAEMKMDTIRLYAISKLGWIKQHQGKIRKQERETPREYIDRESHFVWGRRYLLKLVEDAASPGVDLLPTTMVLRLTRGANGTARQILDGWYRQEVRAAALPLIRKWEKLMEVSVSHVFVQRMKTKWGSCNETLRNIRLNSELAKKPPMCLEYVVVHEMAHLLEPTHNKRFVTLLNSFMPNWEQRRSVLNALPVRHEAWQ